MKADVRLFAYHQALVAAGANAQIIIVVASSLKPTEDVDLVNGIFHAAGKNAGLASPAQIAFPVHRLASLHDFLGANWTPNYPNSKIIKL